MVSRQHKPQLTEAETAESSSVSKYNLSMKKKKMDGRLVERKGLVVVVVGGGERREKGGLPDNTIGRQYKLG
jgi:hypothetical protein